MSRAMEFGGWIPGDARDIARTIALLKKQRVGARAVLLQLGEERPRNVTWDKVEQSMARWEARRSIENSLAASFWQPEQLQLPGLSRRADLYKAGE